MTTPRLGALCSGFSSALFVGYNAIASWRHSGIRRLRPVQNVEHGAGWRIVSAALSDRCSQNVFKLGKIRKFRLDADEMSAGYFLDLDARPMRGRGQHQKRTDVFDAESQFAGAANK